MSVFVIMEKIANISQPVAVRNNEELAMAHCMTLAISLRNDRDRGVVKATDDGAHYSSPNVQYTVHIVDDITEPMR